MTNLGKKVAAPHGVYRGIMVYLRWRQRLLNIEKLIMAMFPYRWSDGQWYNSPEPREQPAGIQPKPKKQWTPRGFFKHHKPMSRREVATRASNTRLWLEYTLSAGPKPATQILRLARAEGINEWSLRRAKKFHRVRSVRTGGKGTGRRNGWIWLFPTPVSQND